MTDLTSIGIVVASPAIGSPLAKDVSLDIVVGNSYTLPNISGSWGSYTVRQLFLPSMISKGPNGDIRITFSTNSSSGTVSDAWVGPAAASGNAWAFDGTQIPITFGGLTSRTCIGSEVFTSDRVSFNLDSTRPLLVSFYCNGLVSAFYGLDSNTELAPQYYISGDNGGVNDGLFLSDSDRIDFITKIEMLPPSAISIVVSSPSIGVPSLLSIAPIGISVGSPTLALPSIGQKHVIGATSVVVAGPVISAPTTYNNMVSADYSALSPFMYTVPLFSAYTVDWAFSVVSIAVGSPTIGSPSLLESMLPVSVIVGSPAIGSPAASVFVANLHASNLVVGSPTIDVSAKINKISQILQAASFTVQSPTIGLPNISDIVNINGTGIIVGSPAIATTATLGQHVIAACQAVSIVVGSPTIGFPVYPNRNIRLIALSVVVDVPLITVPAGNQIALMATGFSVGKPTIGEPLFQVGDLLNPGILADAGSQIIFRQATGLEKALADVDAYQLTSTYAELVRDQWDPYAINYRNLGYLAWAMSVNLWEEDWDESFRRYWIANQWTFKSQRGSLLGISNFVQAAGSNQKTCPYGIYVVSAIVPPAKFYPGKSLTVAERVTYLQRFPQLRIFPYVARALLPYDCFSGQFPVAKSDVVKIHNKNGCFTGPLRKFYPTASDAGGRYTRTAVYWDRGISTNLTFRTIVDESSTYGAVTYDQVTLPNRLNNHWYLDQKAKWPLPRGHNKTQNQYGIFLGIDDAVVSRQVLIPRDTPMQLVQAQAQYQTIIPSMTMMNVYPNYIYQQHTFSPYSLFNGAVNMISPYTTKLSENLTITTTSRVGEIKFTDSSPQIIFSGVWVAGDVINFSMIGVTGSYTVPLNPTTNSVVSGVSGAINALNVPGFATVSSGEIISLFTAPVKNKQFLCRKYLPSSVAWQYTYEQWFLFDPSRVPDYRKASVYMDHARLGIQKYTAELKIAAFSNWKPWFIRSNGYMNGFMRPQDTTMIDKVRRGVTAAMAVRDTVRIDTLIKRQITSGDSLPCDGSFQVGAYIDA